MTPYTPGPLVVELAWSAMRTVAAVAVEAPNLVSVMVSRDEVVGLDLPTALANAQLYAASPDLREAAGEALKTLEEIGAQPAPNGRPWSEDGQVWKTLIALRSAIALADEGRKP